jgi:hypothetical protein
VAKTTGFARRARRVTRSFALVAIATSVTAACSFPEVTFSGEGSADGSVGTDGVEDGLGAIAQGGDPTALADGPPPSNAIPGSDSGARGGSTNANSDANAHDAGSMDVATIRQPGRMDATTSPDAGSEVGRADSGNGVNCDCGPGAMYPTNSCQLLLNSCGPPGFQGPVACGASGTFVTGCTATIVAGLPVACTVATTIQKVQECR